MIKLFSIDGHQSTAEFSRPTRLSVTLVYKKTISKQIKLDSDEIKDFKQEYCCLID